MDIFFIITGLILCIVGLIGSFFPIIPGPITSWIGLVFLHLTTFVPLEIYFLLGTFIIAISIFILDLIIPIIGLKKFGGTKGGQIGAIIGLVIGFFFGPIGLLAGPFLGALSGEIINKSKINIAIKASFGTLLGFIVGASMKFIISFIFLLAFFQKLLTFYDFF